MFIGIKLHQKVSILFQTQRNFFLLKKLSFMNHLINNIKKKLKSNPKNFLTYIELADLYFKNNEINSAKDIYLKSLEIKLTKENLLGLSNCYMSLKEFSSAINCLDKIIKNEWADDFVYNSFGVALRELGKYVSALEKFDLGLKKNSNNHLIYYNKANLFLEILDFDKSKLNFEKCLKIKSDFFPALVNLATLYLKIENTDEALKNLFKAERIVPGDKLVLENIARVLLLQKKYKNSELYFKKLISIDTESLNKIIPVIQGYTYVGDSLNYLESTKYYVKNLLKKPNAYKFNNLKTHKMKIGFVSPDIRNHPIGYFLKDLLPFLSKNFEIYIFNTGGIEDQISNYAKNFSQWKEVSKISNEELSDKIYKEKIDFLFDMSGFTKGNKLEIFKYKPSPIQISWAGWLATTNLKEMDFILGDFFSIPNSDEKNFSEKILRMDNIWCVYSKSELKDIKFQEKNSEDTIFGCFQRPEKLNEKVLTTWSRILTRTRNSYLFFNNGIQQNYDKTQILNFFKKNGISNSRIRFAISRNRINYLNSFNLVDINLDTFPYNGGTTSFESAFMGTPILTLKNESHMFRCGESINHNLSMEKWIAKNHDHYVDIAINFSHKKKINFQKKKFINKFQKSPLFDVELFSKNFYRLLKSI